MERRDNYRPLRFVQRHNNQINQNILDEADERMVNLVRNHWFERRRRLPDEPRPIPYPDISAKKESIDDEYEKLSPTNLISPNDDD